MYSGVSEKLSLHLAVAEGDAATHGGFGFVCTTCTVCLVVHLMSVPDYYWVDRWFKWELQIPGMY